MWAMVAKEMHIPWRSAEAMHWRLGPYDMARRAGVVPFLLSAEETPILYPYSPPPLSQTDTQRLQSTTASDTYEHMEQPADIVPIAQRPGVVPPLLPRPAIVERQSQSSHCHIPPFRIIKTRPFYDPVKGRWG
jgi:hypothetical protein